MGILFVIKVLWYVISSGFFIYKSVNFLSTCLGYTKFGIKCMKFTRRIYKKFFNKPDYNDLEINEYILDSAFRESNSDDTPLIHKNNYTNNFPILKSDNDSNDSNDSENDEIETYYTDANTSSPDKLYSDSCKSNSRSIDYITMDIEDVNLGNYKYNDTRADNPLYDMYGTIYYSPL